MFTLVSQVLSVSPVLQAWNGKQNRRFLTSNALIQKAWFNGIDSKINSVTLKQLYQYDLYAFVQVIKTGVVFAYQGRTYTLVKHNEKGTTLTVMFKGHPEYQGYLSNNTLKTIKQFKLNNDILDVLNGLIKAGL